MREIVVQNGGLASVRRCSTERVGLALALMIQAGLKTYGQAPGLDAWVTVLESRGVLDSEIEVGARHFAARVSSDGSAGSFPSAGEFAAWVIARRAPEVRLECPEGSEVCYPVDVRTGLRLTKDEERAWRDGGCPCP